MFADAISEVKGDFNMEDYKTLAAIGWALVAISPFVWRFIFNMIDDE